MYGGLSNNLRLLLREIAAQAVEKGKAKTPMERMTEPIVRIAHLVSKIEACDREVGRVNATSALGLGYIPIVLSGTAPAIKALFQDAVVWDGFAAVAKLPSKAA
jgi:hypothetical protein